ncbi:Hypothetical predicted protein [Mytilus galloprovincialis]|uniref:Uncharacterized protein n=1 Tax=Mytilus galloprovincialis TaxID=29158 RepID=A0A8B6FX85_MYTGA|nr:Hypothetical predicted protein [Mytilus galloprovincialis]
MESDRLYATAFFMGTTPEPTIQQSAINVVETPNETRVMYSSQQSHNILLKTAIAPVIYNDQEVEYKNTAIENEKGYSTERLPWKHDHPDDIPSGMTVAKRRPENPSQWLVQSRSYINQFEETLQGSNLLPRPPEQTHPQLLESTSHIDTGQELITLKKITAE